MDDALEELQQELEALEAIFEADYLLEAAAEGEDGARFRVAVDEGDARVTLHFAHVKGYPEAPIEVSVRGEEGVGSARRAALQRALATAAEDAVGAPSAFGIVEAARDWLAGGGDAVEDVDAGQFETVDASARAAVEVIAAKAMGTPVNAESFAKWRAAFEAERNSELAATAAVAPAPKPTGREMFETRAADVVAPGSESFWEAAADEYDE